ncbi:MAG: VWA domain-containing protein [candidate division NC10 bacterium]|nr:VWA domain-containing protein [candidate division NC10 bacterium]
MSFQHPSAFLFLLLIPLLLLFHLFKARRIDVRIGSLLFWGENLKEQEPKAPFRRFRPDLLLLLQILSVVSLSLALSRPTLSLPREGYGRILLILDASASMQANDLPGGRFQAAKGEALALIERLKPGQEMMVIEAGRIPKVVLPFTGEKGKLRRAIQGLSPKDTPANLTEALHLGSTLVNGASAEVHLFTDGAFQADGLKLARGTWHVATVNWHLFGKSGRNVGIVAFEVRKTYYGSYDYQAFLSLANYGDERASFELKVSLDDHLLSRKRVTLPPQVKRSIVIPFTYQGSGLVKVTIDPADPFSRDDEALALLPVPRPLKVLLVSERNLFLEQALASDRSLQVDRRKPKAYKGPEGSDVVILDGFAPERLSPGHYLLIDALSKNVPLEVVGKTEAPKILDWDRRHPAMRYLDFSMVTVEEAAKVKSLSGGRALLEASSTPLVYAFEEGEVRGVFVGFDLARSDLPLRTAFPLFISNALRWLSPEHPEEAPILSPGEIWRARFPSSVKEVEVLDPEGLRHLVPLTNGQMRFAGTAHAGVYTAKAREEERKVVVHLFDEEESRIVPRVRVPEPQREKASYRQNVPLWPLFAVLALLALALEGVLFFKRSGLFPPILLRGLLLFLIVLAFLRLQIPWRIDRLNVLFLLDTSESIPSTAMSKALAFIQEALRFRQKDDTAGLVLFGEEASIAIPPTKDFGLPPTVPPPPSPQGTDLEKALRVGIAALPQEGSRRIVLFSDGNQTKGDVYRATLQAEGEGVTIFSLPLKEGRAGEVLLDEVVVPQEVRRGEAFTVKIVAESAEGKEGLLSLLRDGTFLGAERVRLHPGKNVFAYQEALDQEGFHLYEAFLETDGDQDKANNRAMGVVAVRGRLKVLAVEKDLPQGEPLIRALEAQGIEAEMVPPEAFPATLEALLAYDALILSNVSAQRLTKEGMATIRSYVRDVGGGLLMLGGEESFGLGGYEKTPVEEALPVTMEVKRKLEIPPLALIFAIDRSGSMEHEAGRFTKIELAKEAAALVIKFLDPKNQVGVIAFDASSNWIVPLGPVVNKDRIIQEISSLKPGGGTDMFPALKEAYQALYEREALIKHVVLLSDGRSVPGDFESLVKRMAKDKITVSTVAIGSDSDIPLMRQLSRLGRGRFHQTDNAKDLPKIFALETQLASREGLIEQSFRPLVSHLSHEILKEIDWGKVPPLEGYVATASKATADVLLLSPQKDPILAVWRYGLGRAAIFASDLKAKWGVLWLRWEYLNKFLAQLLRWTARKAGPQDVQTLVMLRDGTGEVVLEAMDRNGEFMNLLDTKAGIVSPGNSRIAIPLNQVAPGRYRGSFNAEGEGAYLIGVARGRDGKRFGSHMASLVVPYPLEHRTYEADMALLGELGKLTGGGLLKEPSQVFQFGRKKTRVFRELWPWLLGAALLLLPWELALRLFIRPGQETTPGSAFRWAGPKEVSLYVMRRRR